MKTFRIGYYYTAHVEVEAESKEEAMEIGYNMPINSGDCEYYEDLPASVEEV